CIPGCESDRGVFHYDGPDVGCAARRALLHRAGGGWLGARGLARRSPIPAGLDPPGHARRAFGAEFKRDKVTPAVEDGWLHANNQATEVKRIILASASPRRQAILAMLGADFEVRASDVDEAPRAQESPLTLARRLAEAKAALIAMHAPGRVVL